MLLRANTDSVSGAVGRALLSLTRNTTVATATMALSLNAQTSVAAIAGTRCLDLTDITLPSFLAEALSFKAISMSRAVGNHLAALKRAIGTRPSLLASTRRSFTDTMSTTRGGSGAKRARAINTGSSSAEALSVNTESLSRAVVQTCHTGAVDTGERLRTDLRPLLGTIVRSIIRIALAFTINTETMSMAPVLAVQELARTSMESLMAVALSVTAHSVI